MALNLSAEQSGVQRVVLTVIALWGLGVIAAVEFGLYQPIPRALIGPIIVAGAVLPFLAYRLLPRLRDYLEAVGIRRLTVFHTWRVLAVPVFLWYGATGRLPDVMAQDAAWGDLIAASFSLTLVFLPQRRASYWLFHVVGFADLVIAVGTGLAFTLMGDPRMGAIITLPLALIPLYGVGITAATHLIAFDLLMRDRGLGEALTSSHGLVRHT